MFDDEIKMYMLLSTHVPAELSSFITGSLACLLYFFCILALSDNYVRKEDDSDHFEYVDNA